MLRYRLLRGVKMPCMFLDSLGEQNPSNVLSRWNLDSEDGAVWDE